MYGVKDYRLSMFSVGDSGLHYLQLRCYQVETARISGGENPPEPCNTRWNYKLQKYSRVWDPHREEEMQQVQ